MLIRWQKTIVDKRGNVQPGAILNIRRESNQALARIYRDRDGLRPYPTGTVTADEYGYAYFYAAPDLYRISSAQPAIDWRDENVGFQDLQQASVTYLTKADMLADTSQPVPTLASVVKDSVEENNAFYVWDGSDWALSSLNPATIPDIQAIAVEAVAEATAEAEGYRDQSEVSAQSASQFADQARAAAEASGERELFDTYAEADAAVASIPEGKAVEVLTDEQNAGAHTLYRVESGALVFKLNLDYLEEQLADGVTPGRGASMVYFSQPGGPARSAANKFRDTISVRDYITTPVDGVTSNQVGIELAVNAALETGADLLWPAGVYVSDTNIPNLHKVQHIGKGIISRGEYSFRPGNRRRSDSVRLFISPDGSVDNDGLSPEFPFTLDESTQVLLNYGPTIVGEWRFLLAPGDYPYLSVTSRLSGLSSERFVTFEGPDVGGHPNVPLVTISGVGDGTSLFLARGWGLRLQIKDILFKNTNGAAISATEGMTLQCINVHQENCAQGITWGSHAEIYISGGVHRFLTGFSGFALFRGLFVSKHNIGYRINEDTFAAIGDPQYAGPRLLGNGENRGISLQENCTGHVRSVYVDQFAVGMEVIASSRAHIEYSEFTRNAVAVDVQSGCNIYDNNVIWNGRGSNRNTITVNYRSGIKINSMTSPVVQLVGFVDAQSSTISGPTPAVVATPYTWDGNDNRPGMLIKIVVQGSLAGTNDLKNFRLVCSDTLICSLTFPAAAAGPFYLELGFIKKAGDYVLPFGVGNCAGLSGSASGIGEAVVQYQQVNKILDDGVSKNVALVAFTNSASDTISFGTVHCYRAG